MTSTTETVGTDGRRMDTRVTQLEDEVRALRDRGWNPRFLERIEKVESWRSNFTDRFSRHQHHVMGWSRQVEVLTHQLASHIAVDRKRHQATRKQLADLAQQVQALNRAWNESIPEDPAKLPCGCPKNPPPDPHHCHCDPTCDPVCEGWVRPSDPGTMRFDANGDRIWGDGNDAKKRGNEWTPLGDYACSRYRLRRGESWTDFAYAILKHGERLGLVSSRIDPNNAEQVRVVADFLAGDFRTDESRQHRAKRILTALRDLEGGAK